MKHVVIDARESGTSTGRYIDKLIENLYRLKPKYKFTILTKPNRVDYIKSIAPSFEVQPSRFREFTFAEQLGLLRQIKNLSPDLVHFSMIQQPVLYRGRTVTTMHDLTTARFRNPAKNLLVFKIKQIVYIIVAKWVAKKSRAIITPTEFIKDDVARFASINSRKITVTYEAADKITVPAEEMPDLKGQEFILYVGRPLPHKNLNRLIDALVIIRQTRPQTQLVFAGKKDVLYRRLKRYAKTQGIDDLKVLGFVSEGQLRWLYERASVYAFPSLSEGFGLPPLEAMMHGCPVASSDATCLPEVNGQAAIYFDPNNPEDMAQKIMKVLVDKKLAASLKAKGHAQAGKYSWDRMARQTLEVYDSIFGQG